MKGWQRCVGQSMEHRNSSPEWRGRPNNSNATRIAPLPASDGQVPECRSAGHLDRFWSEMEWEGSQPKPRMHGPQNSDPRIAGESIQLRWRPVLPGAGRMRQTVKRERRKKLTALLHPITPEALGTAYKGLQHRSASGVDGVRWKEHGEVLEERLQNLHRRIQTRGYRAILILWKTQRATLR